MRVAIAIIVTSQLLNTLAAQNRHQGDPGTPTGKRRSILTPIHTPTSLAELARLSPLIVVATCEGELPSRLLVKGDARSDVVTDRIVRVETVLKGNLPLKAELVIRELGGFVSGLESATGVTQTVMGLRPIEYRQKYLLFLRPITEHEGDRFDGRRYWITGVWAGSFHLVNGRVRLSENAEPAIRALDGLAESELLGRARAVVGN